MGGLKGISPLISPDLLRILSQMGHGDEIVLADYHFPSESVGRCGPTVLRADGINIPELLEAILRLLPLDVVGGKSTLYLMAVQASDVAAGETSPPVWDKYLSIANGVEECVEKFEIERFAFYERAKKAFAVVHTGMSALLGIP